MANLYIALGMMPETEICCVIASALFTDPISAGLTNPTEEIPRLIQVIQTRRPPAQVIMILEDREPATLYRAARVRGIVYRSTSASDLITAVRAVVSGHTYYQQPKQEPPTSLLHDPGGERVLQLLGRSKRSLQIAALISEGAKNRQIAEELGTSEQVVKNYLRTIYDHVGCHDRLELALFTVGHPVFAQKAQEELARYRVSRLTSQAC
jgi:DNA-binding NarL/FixJ family response regulator